MERHALRTQSRLEPLHHYSSINSINLLIYQSTPSASIKQIVVVKHLPFAIHLRVFL